MAQEKAKPILAEELSTPERVMLGNLSMAPGFKVLVKLMEDACEEATKSVIKLDPETEDYERLLQVRQQYSRSVHKFCRLVLDSIKYHTEYALEEERQRELEAKVAALRNEPEESIGV